MSLVKAADDGVFRLQETFPVRGGSPSSTIFPDCAILNQAFDGTVVLLDPDPVSCSRRRASLEKAGATAVIAASDNAEVAEVIRLVGSAVVIVSVADSVLGGKLVGAVRAGLNGHSEPVPLIAWQSRLLLHGTPCELHDAGADVVVNDVADADQVLSCVRRLRALLSSAVRHSTRDMAPVGRVLDALPLAVALLDLEGRVCDANHSLQLLWRELTGQPLSCVGILLTEMLVPADRHDATDAVCALSGSEVGAVAEWDCILGNTPSRGIPVSLRLVRVDDPAKGPVLVAQVSDRREHRRLQQALESERWRTLDQHQLQELSGRAHGLLAAALQSVEPVVPGTSEAELVLSATQAAMLRGTLTRSGQLVEAVHAIASDRELPASLVDIRQMVHAHLDVFRQMLPEHVRLRWNGGAEDVVVRGSESLLQQALTALVLNAWDAQRNGGTICVSVEHTEELVVLSVEDEGPGIAVEHHDWIFRPMTSTRTADGASGMGLPNARRTVETHGGQLLLDKSCEVGARFQMLLPRYRARGNSVRSPSFSGVRSPGAK